MVQEIGRKLFNPIKQKFHKGKIILLTGPRQVGKSTLLHEICRQLGPYLFLDGDDPAIRTALDSPNFEEIKLMIGRNKIVFIDEAQRITNIGLTAKMIHDRLKGVQLIMSGSSSLDLGDKLQESLTGRKWEFYMYPISWEEWFNSNDFLTVSQQLEHRVIYGMYPDVLNNPGDETTILMELSKSYLYKDILALGGIKKPDLLEKLVKALAFQIGNEVSYTELAQLLGVDKNTVSSYISLLEKAFVVYRLAPYNTNQRNEIKTNRKIYFYDTGIRNAVINNFSPIALRSDKGALWENFVINERMKFNTYHQRNVNIYFWRGIQGREVDLLEQSDGILNAYEIKWNERTKVKMPATFSRLYNASYAGIHTHNFLPFVAENENTGGTELQPT